MHSASLSEALRLPRTYDIHPLPLLPPGRVQGPLEFSITRSAPEPHIRRDTIGRAFERIKFGVRWTRDANSKCRDRSIVDQDRISAEAVHFTPTNTESRDMAMGGTSESGVDATGRMENTDPARR
jgi:hypothetical protein